MTKDVFFRTARSRRRNVVLVRVAVEGGGELARWLAKRARRMMDQKHVERDLSLSLVGDAEIRRINREWREKDQHTDVLTFPLGINVGSLGDVIVSLDTARRQAQEHGLTLEQELELLLAHGLAHCQMRTHDSARNAERMAWDEIDFLEGRPGIVQAVWGERIERWHRRRALARARERARAKALTARRKKR